MRVLLTNSPSYIKDPDKRFTYGSRFGCVVPLPAEHRVTFYTPYPWSLGYASAILKRDTDHKVKALDAQAKILDDREFMREVDKFKPDLVVAQLPTVSFSLMMEVLQEVKGECWL